MVSVKSKPSVGVHNPSCSNFSACDSRDNHWHALQLLILRLHIGCLLRRATSFTRRIVPKFREIHPIYQMPDARQKRASHASVLN
jgi:hypothetical protein